MMIMFRPMGVGNDDDEKTDVDFDDKNLVDHLDDVDYENGDD